MPGELMESPSFCPSCGEFLDMATPIDKEKSKKPKAGDYTVCLYCGCICRFDTKLKVSKVTEKDLEELSEDERMFLKRLENVRKLILTQTNIKPKKFQ